MPPNIQIIILQLLIEIDLKLQILVQLIQVVQIVVVLVLLIVHKFHHVQVVVQMKVLEIHHEKNFVYKKFNHNYNLYLIISNLNYLQL